MRNIFRNQLILFTFITIGLSSCQKPYAKYSNLTVVLNSYTGSVDEISGSSNIEGEFSGNIDSGIYCFAWENSSSNPSINFSVNSGSTGKVELSLNDAKGKEVLSEQISGAESLDFTGLTNKGKKGTWLVTFTFTDFSGSSSFTLNQ